MAAKLAKTSFGQKCKKWEKSGTWTSKQKTYIKPYTTTKKPPQQKGERMAKKVKCLICGAEFETSRPNKKYCSFSCKEAGRQLQRMKWKEANPHYNAEYMKKYRTAQKEGKL